MICDDNSISKKNNFIQELNKTLQSEKRCVSNWIEVCESNRIEHSVPYQTADQVKIKCEQYSITLNIYKEHIRGGRRTNTYYVSLIQTDLEWSVLGEPSLRGERCEVVFNTIIVSISASEDSGDRDAETATRLIAGSASWPS